MIYDIPKVPINLPRTSFEVKAEAIIPCNDYIRIPSSQADGYNGVIFISTSTGTASNASLSTIQYSYVPFNGVIPKIEIEIHKAGKNMEQAIEIREI